MKFDELADAIIEEGWKDVAAAAMLGLGALKGGGEVKAAEPTAITQQVKASKFANDTELVNYIKRVENSVRDGWDKKSKKWFPHKSHEGGTDTIAYGHKLTQAEEDNGTFSNGLTEDQAIALLKKDIAVHEDRLRYNLPKALKKADKNLKVSYDSLTPAQQRLLLDFEYNPGITVFPNFAQAVVTNDIDTMVKEYKRFSKGKPLNDRNTLYYNTFLKPYITGKKTTADKPQGKYETHVVQKGETLWGISQKYKVSVDSIKRANGLKSDTIHPGQELKIIK